MGCLSPFVYSGSLISLVRLILVWFLFVKATMNGTSCWISFSVCLLWICRKDTVLFFYVNFASCCLVKCLSDLSYLVKSAEYFKIKDHMV